MNCKPGDLAIILRSDKSRWDFLVGTIIQVVKCYTPATSGLPTWTYEGKQHEAEGFILIGWEDADLLPIRDPGEDAVDEVIQRLGSPNKQEQKA